MTRLVLVVFFVVAAMAACTDDGPTPAEFTEAMEGVLADPDTYELTVVSCVNDGEFVDYTWGLENLSDQRKTFAFDPFLTDTDGIELPMLRELVADSVEPGEYREWDSFAGGGERFPLGDVDCRFEVVDSVLGEFRDEG